MTNAESLDPGTAEQLTDLSRKDQFLEILDIHSEIKPIPKQLQILPNDTFESYTTRASHTHIEPGVYIMDPKLNEGGVGKNTVTDLSGSALQLGKVIDEESLDTRGIKSRTGFFALRIINADGETIDLAFRPHEAEGPPMEDFSKNVVMQHQGIANVQTIGFYYDGEGKGGVISVLDKNLRPLNALRRDSPLYMQGLSQAARELAYAHAIGLSHKDFAPRNIVIDTSTSQAMAIDWGAAEQRKPSTNDPEINYSISSVDLRTFHRDLTDDGSGNETFAAFFEMYAQARLDYAIEQSGGVPNTQLLSEELNGFADLLHQSN